MKALQSLFPTSFNTRIHFDINSFINIIKNCRLSLLELHPLCSLVHVQLYNVTTEKTHHFLKTVSKFLVLVCFNT